MQATQATSRKRPAPGTSPLPHQQQPQPTDLSSPNTQEPSQLNDDQFLAWGSQNNNFQDPSAAFNPQWNTSTMAGPNQTNQAAPMSNQLVRRNVNQQLARGPNYDGSGQDMLAGFGQGQGYEWENIEDDEELDRKAAAAKRDAQSKRPPKQIPPFIQKLNSFLDDPINSDLIRWSDDGNSFIVLDEARFADKLIPELFKHKNYASFVRQLNMYGFHKKVGLSDNSMRASEKKAKSPSEYYNPYFKRGRPELLWLIQKPKNESTNSKRKRGKNADQEQGSDEEAKRESPEREGDAADSGRDQRQSKDLVTFPRQEYAALRKEVLALQRSQQQIAQVLSRMRDENQQYFLQAKAFQAQNERHENSINAILTFLATFYNRSLEGHGNIGSLFGHGIPANQRQANVVDVGDYQMSPSSSDSPRQVRRPLALLPAPATSIRDTQSPASVTAPSASPHLQEQNYRRGSHPLQNQLRVPQQSGRVTSASPESSARGSPTPNIKDSPASPGGKPGTETGGEPSPSNNDMMSVINNANAINIDGSTGSNLDFNAALRHYENSSGNGPLTPEQRDNMLSLMANSTGAGNASNSNALTSPNPPPSPSLESYHATREQLDLLQRQMQEQDTKVQDLASRLHPLSPSGSIPGLEYHGLDTYDPQQGFNFNGATDNFDMGNYLNDNYFPEYDNEGTIPADVNFSAPDTGETNHSDTAAPSGTEFGEQRGTEDGEAAAGGRIVGSVGTSSGVHSPAAAVEDEVDDGGMARRSKRRRTQQ